MSKRFLIVLIVVSMLVGTLSSCSRVPKPASARNVELSGFLGDYDLLRPGEEVGSAAIYAFKAPDIKWAEYDSIIIDPVSYWRGRDASNTISAQNAQFLVDEFYYYLNKTDYEGWQAIDIISPRDDRVKSLQLGISLTHKFKEMADRLTEHADEIDGNLEAYRFADNMELIRKLILK